MRRILSFQEVTDGSVERQLGVLVIGSGEDAATHRLPKMSAIDNNPFAEPASENPFNVKYLV